MFAPVRCSMPGVLFFRSTDPLFPVATLLLSRIFLTFSRLWWFWQSCSETYLAGNNFLPHDGWFLLSWRRRMGEDDLYPGIILQSILYNSKTLPKPSSSQPLSCPKAAHPSLLKLMKPWRRSVECCKDQCRVTAENGHCSVPSHPF